MPSRGEGKLSVSTFPHVESILRQPEISELKAAAERLASALADVDEEQLVSEFKELRRRGKGASR